MMRKLILILMLCSCMKARQVGISALAITATAIDWHQTTTITSQCGEANPLIGSCGHGPIDTGTYFMLSMVGIMVVSYVLPDGWTEAWSGTVLGVEGKTVARNYLQGVGF